MHSKEVIPLLSLGTTGKGSYGRKTLAKSQMALIQPHAIHEETVLACYACSYLKMPL